MTAEKVERILCRHCGIEKPIAAYRRWTTSEGNGRKYRLRTCAECHTLKAKQRHKMWRDANAAHVREYGRLSRLKARAKWTPEQRAAANAKMAARATIRREQLKAAVYLAYGGAVCACCGELEPTFLSIDHINNDGYRHRKTPGVGSSGEPFLRWLANNGFPDGFQILCMNCNHGKSRNGGVCPHELEKVQRLERKLVGSSDPKPPALIRCDEVKI